MALTPHLYKCIIVLTWWPDELYMIVPTQTMDPVNIWTGHKYTDIKNIELEQLCWFQRIEVPQAYLKL